MKWQVIPLQSLVRGLRPEDMITRVLMQVMSSIAVAKGTGNRSLTFKF